jgi:leader peptidase (prepilin peptidase) / N-methyltransferase
MGLGLVSVLMHLTVGVSGLLLALIDQKEHRLPDAGTLPTAVVLGTLALVSNDQSRLGLALMSGLLSGTFFALLALLPPKPLGWGDVKLQLLIGFYLGWWSPALVLIQVCVSFVVGGVGAVAMLLGSKLRVSDPIAFGPAMISSTWLTMVFWKTVEII